MRVDVALGEHREVAAGGGGQHGGGADAGDVGGGALDLGGAHAHALVLEHVVAAALVVQEAVLVDMTEVAGVQPQSAAGGGAEGACGLFRRAPVAGHDVRTLDHDLAGLPGRQRVALVVHDEGAGAGQRAADGVRFGVLVRGRQHGDALALGLPELDDHLRAGERGAQSVGGGLRQRGTGVGEHAHPGLAAGVAFGEGADHGGQGRHDGDDGGAGLPDAAQQHQVGLAVGEHDLAAAGRGEQHLVQAVVPGDGEAAEHHVVGAVAEFEIDGLGGEDHPAVRADHRLGGGGGAGGVDEDGDVLGADVRSAGAGPPHPQRGDLPPRLAEAEDRHAAGEGGDPVDGGVRDDDQRGVGVLGDRPQVVVLHAGVDGDQDGAPARGAVQQRDQFAGAGQLDEDPVAVADAALFQPGVDGVAVGGEFPVGPAARAVGDRRGVGAVGGGLVEQVVDQGVGTGLRCRLTVHCDSCRLSCVRPAPVACRMAVAREASFLRSVLRLELSGSASRWWKARGTTAAGSSSRSAGRAGRAARFRRCGRRPVPPCRPRAPPR